MKFLADAHISMEMVAMLRDLGHDCLDCSVIPARMPDVDVLRMAADDERVVITADKDSASLSSFTQFRVLVLSSFASHSRTRPIAWRGFVLCCQSCSRAFPDFS